MVGSGFALAVVFGQAVAGSGPTGPAILSPPKLLGIPKPGEFLSLWPGQWAGSPTLAFRWYRDGQEIPGEDGFQYMVSETDGGLRIGAVVFAIDPTGTRSAVAGTRLVENAPSLPPWEFNFTSSGFVILRSPSPPPEVQAVESAGSILIS